MMEGSGLIQIWIRINYDGSVSGRLKKPADPDPQHWFYGFKAIKFWLYLNYKELKGR
jgi:hypothetical protein